MDELLKQLELRITTLKKALYKAQKDRIPEVEGHLRISVSHGQKRYYHITKAGDSTGSYIPKKNLGFSAALAQKEYNRQFLKEAADELSRLENILTRLSDHNADLAYKKLSDARKCLVAPYITPDEIYARDWQAATFKANNYMSENKRYDTIRGESVRSKSEAILADMLCELGIPYHYEKPLRLKNGTTRYPDFTLLRVKSRVEIYLEHFGLLDDTDYLDSCLQKLDEYRKNSIYPGRNLICTYETAEHPLDIKGIRQMIKDLLL